MSGLRITPVNIQTIQTNHYHHDISVSGKLTQKFDFNKILSLSL